MAKMSFQIRTSPPIVPARTLVLGYRTLDIRCGKGKATPEMATMGALTLGFSFGLGLGLVRDLEERMGTCGRQKGKNGNANRESIHRQIDLDHVRESAKTRRNGNVWKKETQGERKRQRANRHGLQRSRPFKESVTSSHLIASSIRVHW